MKDTEKSLMKNPKWLELQSLQRQQHTLMLNGIVDAQLDKKINDLKVEIRRIALMQGDNLSELDLANRRSLVALMHEYNIVINARDFVNWRPTKRELGDIPGVAEGVTIVATDGLLGYFIDANSVPICGHIDWFTGKVQPLHSFSRTTGGSNVRSPKRKTPQTLEEKTRELLQKLQKEQA